MYSRTLLATSMGLLVLCIYNIDRVHVLTTVCIHNIYAVTVVVLFIVAALMAFYSFTTVQV